MSPYDRWLDDDRPTLAQAQRESIEREKQAYAVEYGRNLVDALGVETMFFASELLGVEFAEITREALRGYKRPAPEGAQSPMTKHMMEAAHG